MLFLFLMKTFMIILFLVKMKGWFWPHGIKLMKMMYNCFVVKS